MSEPKPRQVLKLKLSTSSLPPPAPEQPPSGTTPKLKLKLGGGSKEKAPEAASPSPKLKLGAPKKGKPGLKLTNTKHPRDDVEEESVRPPAKKKARVDPDVKTPKTPKTGNKYIGLKVKGQKPIRPMGEGYDSADPEAESDPAIEEEFILRMLPGEDCEYIRQAIAEKNLGKDGADFRVRFLTADGRRATVRVRDNLYAATLVDMPCIVEGMKSWDRKNWLKCGDICQMLLVLGLVNDDKEAENYPLPPREVDTETWAYAHGLTPPMHWVRQRRFRKRVSAHTIEWVEREVAKLLEKDAQAESVSCQLIDERQLHEASREASGHDDGSEEVSSDEGGRDGRPSRQDSTLPRTADQAMDTATAEAEDSEGDLAVLLEAELDQDAAAQGQVDGGTQHAIGVTTPATEAGGATAPTDSEAETAAPTPAADVTSRDDTGDDEDDEESDADEDAVGYEDEDELERRADLQRQKDEISDLESAIATQREELEKMKNDILKRKVLSRIQRLEDDLKLKRAAIGEGGDD